LSRFARQDPFTIIKGPNWNFHSDSIDLQLIDPHELRDLLIAVGFKKVKLFGSINEEKFDIKKSIDAVFVAYKS
jgi:hypothetical protein